MNKKRFLSMMVVSIILLTMLACLVGSPASPTVTEAPSPTQPLATQTSRPTSKPPQNTQPAQTQPANQTGLHIVGYSNYTDSSGDFHIVGEIKNADTKALNQMELTVEVKDASGKSLLKDSNGNNVASLTISPSLDNLAPGESSPFEFNLSSDAGKPDTFTVKVTGQNTSSVQRPNIQVTNTQMVPSGNGSFYITGEIINLDDKPVEVHNLAGAMLDSAGQVVSTSLSYDYSAYLEPAGNSDELDRTPFIITLDDPGSSPSKWNTYLDAEAVDPIDEYDVSVKIANNYLDENKSVHLVGTVTNDSNVVLNTLIVAGLYAADGTVLDAYATRTPVNVGPGETVPFDISTFSNVNNNSDQANQVDNFSVQIDSYNTFESSIENVLLQTTNDTVAKNGSTWTVSGQVKNTSQKNLSSETVVVMVYDASGALMAVSWDDLFPKGDYYASGDVAPYTVDINFDPGADTSGYTFKTLVKGDVK
jgi:hypothetical protein